MKAVSPRFNLSSIRADKRAANVAFTTSAANQLYKPLCATLGRVESNVDDSHYTVEIGY